VRRISRETARTIATSRPIGDRLHENKVRSLREGRGEPRKNLVLGLGQEKILKKTALKNLMTARSSFPLLGTRLLPPSFRNGKGFCQSAGG
jgi:hypothetical protein